MSKKLPVLNERQKKFCEEYVKDFNASRAALEAGYSPRSAGSQACDLLKNPRIQANLGGVVERSFGITKIQAAEVVSMIKGMAEVDPIDLFDDAGKMKKLSDIPKAARMCISGISHGPHGVSVKLEGRLKALEMLGKYLKLWSDGVNMNIDNSGDGTMQFTVEFTGQRTE